VDTPTPAVDTPSNSALPAIDPLLPEVNKTVTTDDGGRTEPAPGPAAANVAASGLVAPNSSPPPPDAAHILFVKEKLRAKVIKKLVLRLS
jgi:hypothetical protein